MAETQVKTGHPKGLYFLFFTEMWERFSYYGMRAIFILFMTKVLLMKDADASQIYGSYTGLVYLTPLLGGYLCDKFLGNRRSIIIGGLLMAIGQFCMFLSASAGADGGVSIMWMGLTAIIIGNGFFKPNISTMVGQLYPANDRRIDSAFTIFYMGINLGAFFSPLVCGSMDFKWGFLAACVAWLAAGAALASCSIACCFCCASALCLRIASTSSVLLVQTAGTPSISSYLLMTSSQFFVSSASG